MVSGLPTFTVDTFLMEIEDSKNPLTESFNFVESKLHGNPQTFLHKRMEDFFEN